MRNRHPFLVRRGFVLILAGVLVLGACGGGSDSASDSSTTTTTIGLDGPTYATKAFVLPFDVTVPASLPAEATTDTANFVTWETATEADPAVRFLVPVSVYRPGETTATAPPADYLAYLLSQADHGAAFTDQVETAVGGQPATLMTVTVEDSLDGSLGCQAEDLPAGDCYGLQPDLTLRLAVIDAEGTTFLAWLRHDGAGATEDTKEDFATFEQMLGTVTFRDEAPVTTTTQAEAAASPLDGAWTTSFTRDELASSPLLYEPDEVNDQNWGDLTFTFDKGHFTYKQTNASDSYSSAGTFVVEDDTLRLTLDNAEHFEMRWSIDGDTLTFERDDALGIVPTPYVLKPWTRQL